MFSELFRRDFLKTDLYKGGERILKNKDLEVQLRTAVTTKKSFITPTIMHVSVDQNPLFRASLMTVTICLPAINLNCGEG